MRSIPFFQQVYKNILIHENKLMLIVGNIPFFDSDQDSKIFKFKCLFYLPICHYKHANEI